MYQVIESVSSRESNLNERPLAAVRFPDAATLNLPLWYLYVIPSMSGRLKQSARAPSSGYRCIFGDEGCNAFSRPGSREVLAPFSEARFPAAGTFNLSLLNCTKLSKHRRIHCHRINLVGSKLRTLKRKERKDKVKTNWIWRLKVQSGHMSVPWVRTLSASIHAQVLPK